MHAMFIGGAAVSLAAHGSDQMMHSWWGVGIVWWLLGFAVLVLAVVVTWWLIRGIGEPPPETPEEILKKRYDRGEIDREEYEQTMRDLGY